MKGMGPMLLLLAGAGVAYYFWSQQQSGVVTQGGSTGNPITLPYADPSAITYISNPQPLGDLYGPQV